MIPGSAGVPPAQDLAGSWRLASQGWSVHLPTGAGAAPLQECGRDARAPRGKPMAGQVQIRILQKAQVPFCHWFSPRSLPRRKSIRDSLHGYGQYFTENRGEHAFLRDLITWYRDHGPLHGLGRVPRRRLLELLIRNPPPHQQSAINNSLIRLFVCLRGSSCPFVDIVFPFIACRSEAKPPLARIPKRTGEPTLVSVHCEGINGSGPTARPRSVPTWR